MRTPRRKPAVFLDRDGTILRERGYLDDPSRLHFYAHAMSAMRRLQRAGFSLVVVTNQSGVGRGYFTLERLAEVHAAFRRRLSNAGIGLDGLYFCPHRPDAGCACRKPGTGMPRRAARELGLDLKNSYVVGDQDRDLQLGAAIGATPILVLTGGGRAHRRAAREAGAHVTAHLGTAASFILSRSEASVPVTPRRLR